MKSAEPRQVDTKGSKQFTVLKALNIAKAITSTILIILAVQQGDHLLVASQLLSTAMTIAAYRAALSFRRSCLRYLHQLLLADTYQPFDEPCGPGLTVFLISFIGFGFTGPAYLAFHNDIPMSTAAALATMYLFVLGSAVNVAADFYKAGAKDAGAGLVTTGPYRLAIRINYFGDIIRYGSFALCSGRWVSILLPVWVIATTWGALTYQQLPSQQKRYGADFEKYASKTPLLVPYTVPAKPMRNGASDGEAAKTK